MHRRRMQQQGGPYINNYVVVRPSTCPWPLVPRLVVNRPCWSRAGLRVALRGEEESRPALALRSSIKRFLSTLVVVEGGVVVVVVVWWWRRRPSFAAVTHTWHSHRDDSTVVI